MKELGARLGKKGKIYVKKNEKDSCENLEMLKK
jgi:hypothetical protein